MHGETMGEKKNNNNNKKKKKKKNPQLNRNSFLIFGTCTTFHYNIL
jgi:hypothetical protein